MVKKNTWLKLDEAETKEVFDYNDDYKKFLDIARTERLANQEIIKRAKENGFKDLEEVIKWKIFCRPQEQISCSHCLRLKAFE